MFHELLFLPQFNPVTTIVVIITFFILGAALGSFACCQARRLHLKEQKKRLGSRSVCLHCKYQLKWYDNIPLFSWLILGGRCRKCKKSIGYSEIISEFALGFIFALFGANFIFTADFTPLVIIKFPILLLALTALWILLLYDAKWGRLPVSTLVVANLLSLIYAVLTLINSPNLLTALLNLVLAIGLLAGVYYLLYFFSRESLVGSGDWLLCLALALLLGHWWLAVIELFLANLLASIASLPAFVKKGQKKIVFGPFLIIAFIIIHLTSAWLMSLI